MIQIKKGDMLSAPYPGHLQLTDDLRVTSAITIEARELKDGHAIWWVSVSGLYGLQFPVPEATLLRLWADSFGITEAELVVVP